MRQILAIDPGRDKSGLALLCESSGQPAARETVGNANRRAALRVLLLAADVAAVVVGDGTGSAAALEDARAALSELPADRRPDLLVVPERGTTLRARTLYLEENPPRFPWNLLPRTLVPVTAPLDGYAAWAIGLAWLEARRMGRIPFNKNLW